MARLAILKFGKTNEAEMKAGYYREEELAALAKQARQEMGLTQQQAAQKINEAHSEGDNVSASQPVIAMAENNPERPYISLRKAMVEAFSKYKVEGPFYKLTRKK